MKYCGTEIEVRLGDHVLYRRVLLWNTPGQMIYVPGDSPRHTELEYDGIQQHIVQLASGKGIAIPSACGEEFFWRRVTFVSRGDAGEHAVQPHEAVWGLEEGA